MGALARLSHAAVSRGQSSTASFPVRSRFDSTFASLHISRCVTSDFDISSGNRATGVFERTPRFAAMPSPSADLPMLGRAATMIRLPGWKPPVMRSMSRQPDRDPLDAPLEHPLDVAEPGRAPSLRELEHDLLRLVDELLRVAGALPAEPCDLAAEADQAAQRRHLPEGPAARRR